MSRNESAFLRIISILMVIGGIVGLLGCLSIFALATLVPAGSQSGLALAFTLIGGAGSVLQLISGIFGLRAWKNPPQAINCILVGFITLALALANNIYSILSMVSNAYLDVPALILSLLVGLALPILYVVAAFQQHRKNPPVNRAKTSTCKAQVPPTGNGSSEV